MALEDIIEDVSSFAGSNPSVTGGYDVFGTGVVGDPTRGGQTIQDIGGGDDQPSLQNLQQQTAVNTAIRKALGVGSVPQGATGVSILQGLGGMPNGNVPGAMGVKALQLLQQASPLMFAMRGFKGADFIDPNEVAAGRALSLVGMGGKIDPETGAIRGARAGKGTLNMNRLGMVTYSGPPDPTYTGPFQDLVNPPAFISGGENEPYIPPEATAVAVAQPQEPSMVERDYIYPEGGFYPTTGRFYRPSLLDIAPEVYGGLLAGRTAPEFQEMNYAFRRPVDASIYQDPYNLAGYQPYPETASLLG